MATSSRSYEKTIEYIYGIPFEGSTSAGKPLRKLRDITCPYTGIKMIPGTALKGFEKRLKQCKTASDIVDLLGEYLNCMQKTEKSVYAIFKDFVALNPYDDLQNCLQMLYNNCLMRLKLEEFCVLDDVDLLTRALSPATALQVREKTTRCREIILANDKQDSFKRKTFLSSLDTIKPKENEKEILYSIKDRAIFLPTSGTSRNAFVVKYANRTQIEAARRIFIASTATIEHITPASRGGSNHIGNFMLVSANGNRYREDLPLETYINRFPNIPIYTQMYIDDIINAIHNGELEGNEDYPYLVKKKLMKESNGRLTPTLSGYKYSEKEAKELAEEYARNKRRL